MPTVVVFDTNILFSGIGWKGNPFRCVELARAGVIQGVTCRELLDELSEKLQEKLSFTTEEARDTETDLLTFLRVVAIPGTLKVMATDPDDDKVLECAQVAGATHVVTGDRKHLLPLGTFQGIAILSAADFLTASTTP